MSDYKPGTLADIYYADTKVRGLRVPGGWSLETDWAAFLSDDVVSDVRPLVVLDPDDAAFVVGRLRYFADLAGECGSLRGRARGLADQIEAQSRPPKPAEPTGWLAAAVDAEGNRWGRPGGPTDGTNEWYSPDLNARRDWHDIDVVAVLSDGWEPKP